MYSWIQVTLVHFLSQILSFLLMQLFILSKHLHSSQCNEFSYFPGQKCMCDSGLLNLATCTTARFTSTSLNYSVFNLFKSSESSKNMTKYLHRELRYFHHHTNRCVADIQKPLENRLLLLCSCILSMLPVSCKNRQCNVAFESNQPEFRSISNWFYVTVRPRTFSVQHKWVHINLPGRSPRTVLRLQSDKDVGGPAVVPVMLTRPPTMVQGIPPLSSGRGTRRL